MNDKELQQLIKRIKRNDKTLKNVDITIDNPMFAIDPDSGDFVSRTDHFGTLVATALKFNRTITLFKFNGACFSLAVEKAICRALLYGNTVETIELIHVESVYQASIRCSTLGEMLRTCTSVTHITLGKQYNLDMICRRNQQLDPKSTQAAFIDFSRMIMVAESVCQLEAIQALLPYVPDTLSQSKHFGFFHCSKRETSFADAISAQARELSIGFSSFQ